MIFTKIGDMPGLRVLNVISLFCFAGYGDRDAMKRSWAVCR